MIIYILKFTYFERGSFILSVMDTFLLGSLFNLVQIQQWFQNNKRKTPVGILRETLNILFAVRQLCGMGFGVKHLNLTLVMLL